MATLEIPGASKTDLHLIPPEALIIIGLDTEDGKDHPLWDERIKLPLDPNMVKNVAFNGVIENIICRRDGDRLLVVAGRQRTRWAREANKLLKQEGSTQIKVPVVIKRGDEKNSFGLMITENENRVDDEILTKSAKCVRYINMGATEEEAAIAFGVSVPQIKNWLALQDVSAPVRKAVEAGRIAASSAIQLAKLSADEQKKKLDELLAEAPEGKKVSGSKVAKKLGKKKKKKQEDPNDPDVPPNEMLEKVFEHLAALDSKKKLTGKLEGFFDAVSWALGKMATSEIKGFYSEVEDALNPAQEPEEVKDDKKSA